MSSSTKSVVLTALGLIDRIDEFDDDHPLLGGIPEFDSMAVVGVIQALEQEFGIVVEDDDIDADTFETFATLAAFIDRKRG